MKKFLAVAALVALVACAGEKKAEEAMPATDSIATMPADTMMQMDTMAPAAAMPADTAAKP